QDRTGRPVAEGELVPFVRIELDDPPGVLRVGLIVVQRVQGRPRPCTQVPDVILQGHRDPPGGYGFASKIAWTMTASLPRPRSMTTISGLPSREIASSSTEYRTSWPSSSRRTWSSCDT